MIFLLDFETVLTVCFFFHFITCIHHVFHSTTFCHNCAPLKLLLN